MGQIYKIYKFTDLNRQDGSNGRIKDYELYITEDTLDWGEPVSVGQFANTAAPQTVEFDQPLMGRYWKLIALSEVNGNAWASAAEFSVVGCTDLTSGSGTYSNEFKLEAFPVPSIGRITIPVPQTDGLGYQILSADGRSVSAGALDPNTGQHTFDLSGQGRGLYLIILRDKAGSTYRARVLID